MSGEDAAGTDFGEPGEDVLFDVGVFVVGVDEDEVELIGCVREGFEGVHSEDGGFRIVFEEGFHGFVGFFVVFGFAGDGSSAVEVIGSEGPGIDEIEMSVREEGAEVLRGLCFVDADFGDGVDFDVECPGNEGEVGCSVVNGAEVKSFLPIHICSVSF